MNNYKLRTDEVVLYKENVNLKNTQGNTTFILTNINLVLINETCETTGNEITVLEYPINSIKIYEGKPHIRTKGTNAEIYLLETELEVEFKSKIELYKFTNATNKLLTGESTIRKGAKIIREAINIVDDALGINTVQATGNVIKNGVVGNIAGGVGKIGKSLLTKNKK